MNLDQLTLGDIKKLQSFMHTDSEKSDIIDGGIRIVILQRGWVMVGHYFSQGSECWLEDCHVIRYWGTTQGLGELATKGPLKDTKLEPTPKTSFHKLTEIASIQCEADQWQIIK